jgi:hypothetical protein
MQKVRQVSAFEDRYDENYAGSSFQVESWAVESWAIAVVSS